MNCCEMLKITIFLKLLSISVLEEPFFIKYAPRSDHITVIFFRHVDYAF